jgi:predicted RNase H-like nuclease (RuvC/YqgF family)
MGKIQRSIFSEQSISTSQKHQTHYSSELKQLYSKVALLQDENTTLRKEVQELKRLVQSFFVFNFECPQFDKKWKDCLRSKEDTKQMLRQQKYVVFPYQYLGSAGSIFFNLNKEIISRELANFR